jgi:MerR family transcriptional regulator, light-induced transcriptional regulator
VRRIAAERGAGATMAAAIERARRSFAPPARSLYATLRERYPELEPCTLTKRSMLALTRAIEVESLSRAERPLLFAAFQRERFYRRDEARWRELSRGAAATVAFADFARLRVPDDGAIEVPVAPGDPLLREWAVVCDAPSRPATRCCASGRSSAMPRATACA